MKKEIVGIDPSLNGTGIAVLTDKCFITETINKFIKEIKTTQDKYIFVKNRIMSYINKNSTVFFEDYAFNAKNTNSLTVLAELNGIIKLEIYETTGMWPFTIAIGTIKKWLCGKGILPKDDFKMEGYKRWGIEFKTGDEVIAYTLADLAWHLTKKPSRRKLTKNEIKQLETIIKNRSKLDPRFLSLSLL